MNRRVLLRTLIGAIGATQTIALAQPRPDPPLVALLVPGSQDFARVRVDALRGGLKEAGFVDGHHYTLATRFADGDFARLPGLARDLKDLKPRVFVASANAVFVVHEVAPELPLVFTSIGVDPVQRGLAQSYERPGGHATGNVQIAVGGEASLTQKRLGLFRACVPGLTRLGMIGVVDGRLSTQEAGALRLACSQSRIAFSTHEVRTVDDLPQAFAEAQRDAVDGLYVSGEPLLFNNMSRVMPLLAAAARPSFGVYPEWARAGVMLAYSTDIPDGFRHAGLYVAKILQGTRPGDLPIEQATKFTLVVNLKTMATLGLAAPASVIALADDVIE